MCELMSQLAIVRVIIPTGYCNRLCPSVCPSARPSVTLSPPRRLVRFQPNFVYSSPYPTCRIVIFGPSPGPLEGSKSQIKKKEFISKPLLTTKDTKRIRRDFSCDTRSCPKGWDWRCVGGIKNKSVQNMVVQHTKLKKMKSRAVLKQKGCPRVNVGQKDKRRKTTTFCDLTYKKTCEFAMARHLFLVWVYIHFLRQFV